MKNCGYYSPVSNNTRTEEVNNYDVDHVINDTIQKLDEIIEGSDIGFSNTSDNYKLILKASISHLIDKL